MPTQEWILGESELGIDTILGGAAVGTTHIFMDARIRFDLIPRMGSAPFKPPWELDVSELGIDTYLS